MPRKAPDQVIEHRISLSNFERSQIIEQLEKTRDSRLISAGISQVGALIGSGALLYGVASYFGFTLLGKGKDTFNKVTNTMSDYLFDIITMGQPVADPIKEATFANAFDRLDQAILVHEELNNLATAELIGIRTEQAQTGSTTATSRMLEIVERINLLKKLRQSIEITRDRVREFNRAYVANPTGNNCPYWLGLENWKDLLRSCDAYPNNVMPDWTPLFQS